VTILYLLATIALLVGTAAIYMALIQIFPVQWLYYHYFIRKPVVWSLLGVGLFWVAWGAFNTGSLQPEVVVPLGLLGLAVVLTYRMHQETAFPAVDYPDMSDDPRQLPLTDTMQLLIVADSRTKTFFQQATFESLIGRLHPHTLTMIPFQILPWREVKHLEPLPQVCRVTAEDFSEFQLPIPGVWKKIMASEATPGLSSEKRDVSFPARTHVIGIIDPTAMPQVVYIKNELTRRGIIKNEELNVFFVAVGDTVNAFKGLVAGEPINLVISEDNVLSDISSGTEWNVRGKYLGGSIESDLEPLAISDEYWFSWKEFHPDSQLIRLK